MSDGTGQAMDGTFEAVDPKLNVFALANGMDLTKSDDSRSLEWFTEGLERSLPIEPDGTATFSVHARAWKPKSPDEVTEESLGEEVSAEDLMSLFTTGIESANAL